MPTQERRKILWKTSLLAGVFAAVVGLYGAFAVQGPLPLLSPDETAAFTTAKALLPDGPAVAEPRAEGFSWLHPRSYVARDGRLAMAGFPVWSALLAPVGWFFDGRLALFLAVLVSASLVIPLALWAERSFGWTRAEAAAWAVAAATLPTLVLYGNRSLFTLVPQLALAAWAAWLLELPPDGARGRSFFGGLVAALAVGVRPVEAVWLVPGFLLLLGLRRRGGIPWRAFAPAAGGFALGALFGAGAHAWFYGAPWRIGYFLRDVPPVPGPAAAGVPLAWWRPFFPYGFSLRHAWENVRGAWSLGWWPWLLAWVAAGAGWGWRRARAAATGERLFVAWLCFATAWLGFYYGQGRYADHVGGQLFHLGNSLFRYLAPLAVLWTLFALWLVRTALPGRWGRYVLLSLVALSAAAGVRWAYADGEDGLLRGRQERLHYADVRAFVARESPSSTVWLSERSDKMLFPARAAATPLPSLEEIRRFLEAGEGPVWLYRRPFNQLERDRWRDAGLEIVEKARYDRENVYEIRRSASR